MADYYTSTVVQPEIPLTDMTALEHLVLTNMFSTEVIDGELYLYAEDGPSTDLFLSVREIQQALQASAGQESQLLPLLEALLAASSADATEIEVDLSGTSYEYVLQDIVRRSRTVPYVTVVSSFTCSKMRPDGFGGCATLITPHAIEGVSTHTFLEERIAAHGLDTSRRPLPATVSEREEIEVPPDR